MIKREEIKIEEVGELYKIIIGPNFHIVQDIIWLSKAGLLELKKALEEYKI